METGIGLHEGFGAKNMYYALVQKGYVCINEHLEGDTLWEFCAYDVLSDSINNLTYILPKATPFSNELQKNYFVSLLNKRVTIENRKSLPYIHILYISV